MIYLSSYLTPVKTEFANPSIKVDFRGDDDCRPLLYSLDNTSYLVSPQISQYSYFLRPISSNPLSPHNFLSQTIGIYFTQSYIFSLVDYKLVTWLHSVLLFCFVFSSFMSNNFLFVETQTFVMKVCVWKLDIQSRLPCGIT